MNKWVDLDEYSEYKKEKVIDDELYSENLKEAFTNAYNVALNSSKGSADKLITTLNNFEVRNRNYNEKKEIRLFVGDVVVAETKQGTRPAMVYEVIEQGKAWKVLPVFSNDNNQCKNAYDYLNPDLNADKTKWIVGRELGFERYSFIDTLHVNNIEKYDIDRILFNIKNKSKENGEIFVKTIVNCANQIQNPQIYKELKYYKNELKKTQTENNKKQNLQTNNNAILLKYNDLSLQLDKANETLQKLETENKILKSSNEELCEKFNKIIDYLENKVKTAEEKLEKYEKAEITNAKNKINHNEVDYNEDIEL